MQSLITPAEASSSHPCRIVCRSTTRDYDQPPSNEERAHLSCSYIAPKWNSAHNWVIFIWNDIAPYNGNTASPAAGNEQFICYHCCLIWQLTKYLCSPHSACLSAQPAVLLYSWDTIRHFAFRFFINVSSSSLLPSDDRPPFSQKKMTPGIAPLPL